MVNLENTIESISGRYGSEFHTPDPRPEPAPREERYRLVSVDDHLVEPPHTFAGRLPSAYEAFAPKVVRDDQGADHWQFEDELVPLTSSDALQTWDYEDWYVGPVSFDTIRRGTWDINERVRDMDINRVSASLNFPSIVFGFAGQRFMRMKDAGLGLACMRAYNDWMIEEWAGPYPERIIPCQVTWLLDAETAAKEIEHNAARGFKAVSFTENPEKLGLPSIYTDYWDPFFAACEETGTVVNLHVGSSSETVVPSKDSPPQIIASLFAVNGLMATMDWLFAKVPVKFPAINIAISEGGIGWVPMLIDRLRVDKRFPKFHPNGLGDDWGVTDASPEDVLHRNFWFTTYWDPLALEHRDEIGVDRIMFESDYPHADSTWPDTQAVIAEQVAQVGDMTDEEIARVTHGNAMRLYRHQLAG